MRTTHVRETNPEESLIRCGKIKPTKSTIKKMDNRNLGLRPGSFFKFFIRNILYHALILRRVQVTKHRTENRTVTEKRKKSFKHTHTTSISRHHCDGTITFKEVSKQFIPQTKRYRYELTFDHAMPSYGAQTNAFDEWCKAHSGAQHQTSSNQYDTNKDKPEKMTVEWVDKSYPLTNDFMDLRTGLRLVKEEVKKLSKWGKGYYIWDNADTLREIGKQNYTYLFEGCDHEMGATQSDHSVKRSKSTEQTGDSLLSSHPGPWH